MIIHNTVANKQVVKAGTVISTTPEEAATLIACKRAVPFDEYKKQNGVEETGETETLENRAIQPKELKQRPLKTKGLKLKRGSKKK